MIRNVHETNKFGMREFLQENAFYLERRPRLNDHSHGTLREISSFMNWKANQGIYSRKFATKIVDHASRFHGL